MSLARAAAVKEGARLTCASASSGSSIGDRVAPLRVRALLGVESRRVGRPPLGAESVALIVRMARENPTRGRRRIPNELAKLGHDVGKDAVARYMPKPSERPPRPPSETWGTFVRLRGSERYD